MIDTDATAAIAEERDYALCRYCGARLELTALQVSLWRSTNAWARKKGQPIFGPHEIWPCPAPSDCHKRWCVEVRDRGMAAYRRDRAAAAQPELPLAK